MKTPALHNLIYYIYDSRSCYTEPVAAVYNREHIEKVVRALYDEYPQFIHISTRRLHNWNPNDSHLGHYSKGK